MERGVPPKTTRGELGSIPPLYPALPAPLSSLLGEYPNRIHLTVLHNLVCRRQPA